MIKPMLAATLKDVSALTFPKLISPKLDGIRCIVKDGVALSRSLKPIPNKYVQSMFGHWKYDGLDGELIVGDPTSKTCYRDTNSGVMSIEGDPNVTFHVFDCWSDPDLDFTARLNIAGQILQGERCIALVEHVFVYNHEGLTSIEERWLEMGYEGAMLRNLEGVYKSGRATEKSQDLMKLKRFTDSEAVIVGMEELLHNGNEATVDALGHTKRSSHASGKNGRGSMGSLVVKDLTSGVIFNIGTGFTSDERIIFWLNTNMYIGKIVKYKSFSVGVKNLPRFPVFLGMRDSMDFTL
jgi:DNA ligase-1